MAAKPHLLTSPAERSIHLADANFSTRCLVAEMRRRLFFLAGLFFIILRPEMNAEKPFNFEETPGKLPKDVVPIE